MQGNGGVETHLQQIANVMLNDKTIGRKSGIFINIIIIFHSAASSSQSF